MLYVQQSLAPDEELIHVGHFHWMYTLQAFMSIVWGILLCIAIIIGAVYVQQYTGMSFGQPVRPGDSWLEAVRKLHPGLRLLGFFFFVLGLFRFAQMMVVKATTEIAVTTSRLIFKRGLIARKVGELSIDRVEGVHVLQGIMGRIFDYGRLLIRGMGVGEVVLPPIANPVGFRKALEKARTV